MNNGPEMLTWFSSRRSIREFTQAPVGRDVLKRLVQAAVSAPSATNRQPWRFAIVTGQARRAAIVGAIRTRVAAVEAVIARGHHAEDYGRYGDFFFEPLQTAAAIVVPQYRTHPDLIADLIESGGGDRRDFDTAATMQAELCSMSAGVMALLLQAHAEGLGACWMAGPMVARRDIEPLLGIGDPWHMAGAIAVGHPVAVPPAPPRKPLDRVAVWIDD